MSDNRDSTLAALLREKRSRRGRPRRAVSRQNVYVALSARQKETMKQLADLLPDCVQRADVPDLAIALLSVRIEALRRSVADRDREMPEGITAFDGLYLLWDLPLPDQELEARWTTVRLSPQQGIDLGRTQGAMKMLFGASRSEVFSLGLALLAQEAQETWLDEWDGETLSDLKAAFSSRFL